MSTADRMRAQPLEHAWNALVAKTPPELITMASSIYWKALEQYQMTQRAVLQSMFTQLYNRSLTGALKRAELPHLTVSDFLFLLSITDSIPLLYFGTPKGGTYVVPMIVSRTFTERSMAGRLQDDEKDLMDGGRGPLLSQKGLELAHIPFGVEEFDAAPKVPESLAEGQNEATRD